METGPGDLDDVVLLETAERQGRLASACGSDLELQFEVETLLACDRSSTDIIERLVAEAALEVDAASALERAMTLHRSSAATGS